MRIRTMLGVVGLGLSLLMGAAGCQFSKQAQLENVAKDWCLTIRASQVIPVYPLTEDLQPGDVFLVTVPVDEQQKIYERRGFLALDNHLARLDPGGYQDFYDHSFVKPLRPAGAANQVTLPRDWMRPPGIASWEPAPNAAFPTYSFSVRRGGGLNLAVPVSGVPLGMSLMGSDAADGTVSIRKSRTLGVDMLSMYRDVQDWAISNADFLKNYASDPRAEKQRYLRVVTRVYVTGEMDVFLADASRAGAGVDAGAPKPVDLMQATTTQRGPDGTADPRPQTVEDYNEAIKKLNEALAESARTVSATAVPLPGGSVRVTAAAGRTISMKETFEKPLVLGYLAFDVPIRARGALGRPIPTLAVIERGERPDDEPIAAAYRNIVTMDIYRALRSEGGRGPGAMVVEKLDSLAARVPADYRGYSLGEGGELMERIHAGPTEGTGTFEDYRGYRSRLETSVAALSQILAEGAFKFRPAQGEPEAVEPGSATRSRLSTALAELRKAVDDPARRREETALTDAAIGAYLNGD